jgi:hypothetical protein
MMQQSEAFQRELRAHYAAIVEDTFSRARHCLSLARVAQQAGHCAEVRKWMWSVRVLRIAAAEWRKRAERVAPVLICLVAFLHGCAKAPALDVPSREVTAHFEVQPSPDGRSIVWSLQFKSRDQYHAFIDSAANGAERAKVRELIAAGLQLHHIVGCSAREKEVTKLGNDGVAFIGSCGSNPAHATPTGGI